MHCYRVDGPLLEILEWLRGATFAVLPGGKLVYSLDREAFQTLGLPAKAVRPASTSRRPGGDKPRRYFGSADLHSKSFRPGKPLHDRLVQCLAKGARAETMLVWDGGGAGAFPASLAATRVAMEPHARVFQRVCCPQLRRAALTPALPPRERCRLIADMFAWLGVVACGLEDLLARPPLEPYVSSFEVPAGLAYGGSGARVCRVRLRGLIPVQYARTRAAAVTPTSAALHVLRLCSKAAQAAAATAADIAKTTGAWAAVTTWGFQDCPGVVDGRGEAVAHAGGDSILAVIAIGGGGEGQGQDVAGGGGVSLAVVDAQCLRPLP
ncbi:ribonuclease P [Tribonema minus]|uniref:Ribonuclease P n=1 Tax=Tribonema minus TaxID=303371 RepID=A0A835ZFG0_9STRA|nr:ribonuclease P [Tribonema minus]